ncbi:MAG: hypothetical protein Q4F11_03170 [Eubacteriales bacterium]|nr:hypothetical protein [Eubacteriales bacterium]
MDKSWKIFRSESGLCSLENRSLEERSFYRMKVFLKNFFKEQYREKPPEQEHRSFFFYLAMNIRGKDAKDESSKAEQSNSCSMDFFIGKRKFLLTWDEVYGLVITAVDVSGNDVITSLEGEIVKQNNWF